MRKCANSAEVSCAAGEFAHLRIRYKLPGEGASELIERPITPGDAVSRLSDASVDARFSAQVAGFSQLLRGDPYLQNGYDYDSVLDGVDGLSGQDVYGYRSQFLELVEIARYVAWQDDLKVY